MYYTLPGIQLHTDIPLPSSFVPFQAERQNHLPLITLTNGQEPPGVGKAQFTVPHTGFIITALDDGWLYCRSDSENYILHASRNYKKLTVYINDPQPQPEKLLPLLRPALECASAYHGVVSLHSACVKLDSRAVCFTAPSGTGKSTRARKWEQFHGAEILSGDRPELRITAGGADACGVPWDGKEQIFIHDSAPLLAICCIRRSRTTRIRKLSENQARRVLLQQCFVPMWDTDIAAAVMLHIRKICRTVPIYRVLCGPDEAAAREVRDILYSHPEKIHEIENTMKIKNGFVLRNVTGEHIVMPTGQNIKNFDGAIVLNDVAAFIWEKMQESVSRNELLEYVLAEFDVSEELAAKDLDALIEKLRGYGVIEDETI